MVSHKEIASKAFNAIYQHLDTLTREHIIDPVDFTTIRAALTDASRQVEKLTVQQNLDAIKEVLNTVMDNNAPVRFFKKLAETRMNGSLGVQNIAQFTARLGLIYYFELLSNGGDFSDLQSFRERAIGLKRQAEDLISLIETSPLTFEPIANSASCKRSSKETLIASQRQVINRIDEMIYLLGQSVSLQSTQHLHGTWHALAASYHLFGNVSQAYDITQLSLGVSGANLPRVIYHKDN